MVQLEAGSNLQAASGREMAVAPFLFAEVHGMLSTASLIDGPKTFLFEPAKGLPLTPRKSSEANRKK
jgi:hypothetical protein